MNDILPKNTYMAIKPNHFFKEQIDKISVPGKLLLPGEGEGRNAVYAAKAWLEGGCF